MATSVGKSRVASSVFWPTGDINRPRCVMFVKSLVEQRTRRISSRFGTSSYYKPERCVLLVGSVPWFSMPSTMAFPPWWSFSMHRAKGDGFSLAKVQVLIIFIVNCSWGAGTFVLVGGTVLVDKIDRIRTTNARYIALLGSAFPHVGRLHRQIVKLT
jgi:hypothetical protein